MANLGSKRDFKKRDVNFFDEFTASARKQAQMLGILVVSLLILVGIFVVWLIACIIRNVGMDAAIKVANDKLNSPEYTSIEAEAAELEVELTSNNQYYYALTEMRRTIDEIDPAETEICDILGESIPNDTYVDTYSVSGTTFSFTGYTFSYYSAMNMVYLIQNSDVFSLPPDITVDRVNTVSVGGSSTNANDDELNVIDVYYKITVNGTLTTQVNVSIARFATGDTISALGGIESTKYDVGTTYEYSDLGTYSYNGHTYSVTNITVNGNGLSADEVAAVASGAPLTGVARGDVNIVLYYSIVEATEGGEA